MNLDFQAQRLAMVKYQLKARDITDPSTLQVMSQVPREQFVPTELKPHAYQDRPLLIGQGQTISQPYIVALMCQLLELEPDYKVLEIGTGSGYQAAILSQLAAQVISLEVKPDLARQAETVLSRLHCDNVQVLIQDGKLGYSPAAPYHGIISAAAAKQIPPAWKTQLADGGRLVLPLAKKGTQTLIRLTRKGSQLTQESFGSVVFVPLL